jgi:tRNA-(ms[2]io[6]A)-hydroxylase
MLGLRWQTPRAWVDAVLADFVTFLQDHAANERKVSQSALVLATHYPNRADLVDLALEIAEEELAHFRDVWRLLKTRGEPLGPDAPDPYMKALFALMRKRDMDEYLLDRLVLYAIVEARGCERFGLVADALPESDPLKAFYLDLTRSEARHHAHYLRLARAYFPADVVAERLDALLDHEAEIARALPFRPALH